MLSACRLLYPLTISKALLKHGRQGLSSLLDSTIRVLSHSSDVRTCADKTRFLHQTVDSDLEGSAVKAGCGERCFWGYTDYRESD